MNQLLNDIRVFRADLGLMLDPENPDSLRRTLEKVGEILEDLAGRVEKIERENATDAALLCAAGEGVRHEGFCKQK